MAVKTPPVCVVLFANQGGELSQLKKESATLRDLLLPLEKTNTIKLIREESAEIDDLRKLLLPYKDDICLFHYGGHADGKQLYLEDESGRAQGIAQYLSLMSNLQLVFLNACSTQEQALPYLQAGVPAVLATTVPVKDQQALQFATAFYQALRDQCSIQASFAAAKASLLTKRPYELAANADMITYRGLSLRSEVPDQQPWQLYVQAGQERVLDWKLPHTPIKSGSSPDVQVNNYGSVKTQINNPDIKGDLHIH